MTEFETATIAYQNATIAFQDATIAYQNASLWVSYGQIAATIAVGVLHAVLIIGGLRMMRRTADSRDAALDAQRRADEARHAEAMRALEALIARTARAGR